MALRLREAWPRKTRCSCSSFGPIWPARRSSWRSAAKAHDSAKMSVDALKGKLKERIETSQRALKERRKAQVMKVAADAIVELQSYGVASTADKFLEQIKQEVAESKAAVEVATGGIDTQAIERDRTVAEAQGGRHPSAV